MKNKSGFPALIVFYDGVCNICNAAVRFIIRYDKNQLIHFASLQSKIAREILGNDVSLETLVFYENGIPHIRSTGALRIAKYLRYFHFAYYLIFIPRSFRDLFYDLIAKYRYRIFGKKDSCPVPNESIMHLFIDQHTQS